MSKKPWPDRLKTITRSSPSCRAATASSIAARMACDDSGAGMKPSVRANWTAASKHVFWAYARASRKPELVQVADHRRHAVVAQPAGVDRGRPEVVAKGVHLDHRRHAGRVAEVVAVLALGQARAGRRLDRQEAGLRRAVAAGRAAAGRRCRRSSSRHRHSRSRRRASRRPSPAAWPPPGRSPSGAAARGSARCPASTWCPRWWPPPPAPR